MLLYSPCSSSGSSSSSSGSSSSSSSGINGSSSSSSSSSSCSSSCCCCTCCCCSNQSTVLELFHVRLSCRERNLRGFLACRFFTGRRPSRSWINSLKALTLRLINQDNKQHQTSSTIMQVTSLRLASSCSLRSKTPVVQYVNLVVGHWRDSNLIW